MDISRWSTTAANNDDNAPDGAKEGWYGGEVNAWARETMAAIRTDWQEDQWRDISQAEGAGSSRYTVTRDSDTQITVGGVDLSGVLFVGQRIRVVNASSAVTLGVVVSATYGAPDTAIVIDVDEGEDDGTSLLTTGNLSFTAGSPGSITRVTGSWVTDGFVSGDRLRITGTDDNNGFYTVSNVAATTMDITPVGQYSVITEGAGAGNAYRISTTSAIVAGPLTSVWITGAHVDETRKESPTGNNPLDFVTHEKLGDAAYKREDDLYVARAVLADSATLLSDAALADLIHVQRLASDFTYNDGVDGAQKDVPDWDDCPFPGTPDGAKEYMIQVYFRGIQGGIDAGGFVSLALFVGPSGSTTRKYACKQSTQWVGSGSTFDNVLTFFVTPAASDVWEFKAEGSPGAGVSWTLYSDPTPGSDFTFTQAGLGSFVVVREVTRDAT